jgi:hypothetical protein
MKTTLLARKIASKVAPRGVRIYRTGGPDAPPWFMWNRYPGVTIGFAVRVAPRHLLSIVWRRA